MPGVTSGTKPYRTQCLEPETLSRYHPVINWNTASPWHYDVSNMSFSSLVTDRPISESITNCIFVSEAFVCPANCCTFRDRTVYSHNQWKDHILRSYLEDTLRSVRLENIRPMIGNSQKEKKSN